MNDFTNNDILDFGPVRDTTKDIMQKCNYTPPLLYIGFTEKVQYSGLYCSLYMAPSRQLASSTTLT